MVRISAVAALLAAPAVVSAAPSLNSTRNLIPGAYIFEFADGHVRGPSLRTASGEAYRLGCVGHGCRHRHVWPGANAPQLQGIQGHIGAAPRPGQGRATGGQDCLFAGHQAILASPGVFHPQAARGAFRWPFPHETRCLDCA